MHSFRTLIVAGAVLLCSGSLLAQNPLMIKDINPGTASAFFAGDNMWVSRDIVNSVFFIQANDGTNGTEVWKSISPYTDASLVKDLNPGTAKGSSGEYLGAFDKLFFNGGATGTDPVLCWSNGTPQGTGVITTGKAGFFAGLIIVSQGQLSTHQQYLHYGRRPSSSRLSTYLWIAAETSPTRLLATIMRIPSYRAPSVTSRMRLASGKIWPTPAEKAESATYPS